MCSDKGLIKVVPVKGDYDAIRDKARKIEARMAADRERACTAAERKHGVPAKEKAAHRSTGRCAALENQIAETPAHGIVGVAIKLASAKHNEDFLSEPCDALVLSAYKTLIKVAGLPDYAAQAKRW